MQASNLDLFSATRPNEFAETLSFFNWVLSFIAEVLIFLLSFEGCFYIKFEFSLSFESFLTN